MSGPEAVSYARFALNLTPVGFQADGRQPKAGIADFVAGPLPVRTNEDGSRNRDQDPDVEIPGSSERPSGECLDRKRSSYARFALNLT